jgi:RNase H-fold protein (predicted Holliday junction resolvase)
MIILGFDPGKDKCGVAVSIEDRSLVYHQVIPTPEVIDRLNELIIKYQVDRVVMGDRTTAKQWQQQLIINFPELPIELVDEHYSTLAARDRYWQMYPPTFTQKLIPQGLRQPPRPIDDIVAIILIERFYNAIGNTD